MTRIFTDSSPITYCIGDSTSPLIKISKNGDIDFSNTNNRKLDMLKNITPGDNLIIAWSGKYSTDIFKLSKEDIQIAIEYLTT